MSVSSDVEQFSLFWTLAGRPELFDPADDLADLGFDAAKTGIDSKMFLRGYSIAAELGSQSPPGQMLSRLAVYRKVKELAEAYRRDPTDFSWMPDHQAKKTYLNLVTEADGLIDELYAALLEQVSSYETPGGNVCRV